MTKGMPLYFLGTVSYLIAVLSVLCLLFSLLQDYLWTNPHLFSSESASSSAGYRRTSELVLCCVCVFLPVLCCSGFHRSGCSFHWALQLNGCIKYGFIYLDNDKFSCLFVFFNFFGFQFFSNLFRKSFLLNPQTCGFSLFLEGLICSQLQFMTSWQCWVWWPRMLMLVLFRFFSCSFVYLFFSQTFEYFRDSFIF